MHSTTLNSEMSFTISQNTFLKNDNRYRKKLHIFDVMAAADLTDEMIIRSIAEFLKTDAAVHDYGGDQAVKRLLSWLMDAFSKHEEAECHILRAITKTIKCFPECRNLILIGLFCPQSLIYGRSELDGLIKKEYVQFVLDCIDSIFNDTENLTPSDEQLMSGEAVLRYLCWLLYRPNFNTSQFPNIVFHSLILLKRVVLFCKNDVPLYMGELLGICMTYMFIGNSVKDGRFERPRKVLPSSLYIINLTDDLDSVEPNTHSKLCGKFLKQKKSRSNNTRAISAEAFESCSRTENEVDTVEFAKSYSDTQGNCNKEFKFQMRIASIYLLGDIVRCVQQRVLYSYWQSLFPCDFEESKNIRSDIFLVSETDENSKCRYAALQVCVDLFLSSKSLFSQAEFKNRSAAFIPLSQKLGLTIISAFESVVITIKRDTSLIVLIQALKFATALVQVTDFTKFECGFLYHFLNVIQKLVSHKDLTVQVSALTVLECALVESKLPTAALEALVLYRDYSSSDRIVNEFDIHISEKKVKEKWIDGRSWLVSKTLYNLGYLQDERRVRNIQIPNPLRIKSFQMLSAMALHFEIFLKDHLDIVAIVLEEALKDKQSEIRLCGSKCLDAVVYQMGIVLESDNTINIDKCAGFWARILPSIIYKIQMEKEFCTIRITLVDAISNMGISVFEHLPQSTRISLLSFLTGVCSETTEDVIIRANVVRTLSIFVTFSSMRTNLVFIENTAGLLLRLAGDKNIYVRIKILWAMGNISDALLENSIESSNERISDDILWSLIKQATEACNDNDKVRCNAVRALGNLMRLLSDKHFIKDFNRTLIKLAINKLIDGIRTSGTSKVKWNSCYAVGNVLQNESIFVCMDMYKDVSWQSELYSSLCHVICSNSNYKVKINASTAITHISKRSYMGEYCGKIWKTIIRAIEQSHNLLNFYEYNHRDLLQEQLCLLLCHVINLASLDDYILFSRVLLERMEVVRTTWIRVTRRMIPEKAAPLLACSSRLYEELKRNILNSEQKNSVKLILDAIPLNY